MIALIHCENIGKNRIFSNWLFKSGASMIKKKLPKTQGRTKALNTEVMFLAWVKKAIEMRWLGNSFDNLLGLFADGTSSDHCLCLEFEWR